jgi:hypothetical protein
VTTIIQAQLARNGQHVVLARILQHRQMLKQTVFAATALMNFTNLPVLSQALHALHGAPVLLEDL